MTSFCKLFIIIFTPISLIILFGFYINYEISYEKAKNNFYQKISNDWELINNIHFNNLESLDTYNYIKKISNDSKIRITIISNDGKVLVDSAVNYLDIKKMQDHKERTEISYALNDSPYYSLRKSPTTRELTLYYAKKSKNNNILRISTNATYLNDIKIDTLKSSAIIFTFILTASFFISILIAHSISKPLNSIKKYCNAINTGQNNYPLPHFNDKSINEIAETIYNTHANFLKEKELTQIEKEKLNSIISSLDEGIILLNKNGEIIYLNSNCRNYLSTSLDESINVFNGINDIELINFFKEIINNKDDAPYKTIYKDLIFEIYSKVIYNQILCVFKEVTDSSRYEAFKTELIGNIIHEIKTPLSLIMAGSETILNDDNMPEDVKNKFIETIFRNSKKLNNIIDDIMELHQLELSNKNQIISELVSIKDIIDDVSALINKDNKDIIYNYNEDDRVYIKPEHIESIIINFVNNGIKYSTGDEIIVDVIKNNNKLIISVSDKGPIIAKSDRKRIFERFYTISKSRTKSYSGTGLGLSIVKHIVKLYNGKVRVRENSLGGNTFEAILIENN